MAPFFVFFFFFFVARASEEAPPPSSTLDANSYARCYLLIVMPEGAAHEKKPEDEGENA